MCAYSLDHITPSRLGATGFGGTKPELEYNDSINKVSLDTRLSLYDTSGHSVSKRSLHSSFQRTHPRPQRPRCFKSLCVCAIQSFTAHSVRVVGLGGLEPPASPLSGVRSNHLSYRPNVLTGWWWSLSGSNRRPPACKAGALPAELKPHRNGTVPRHPVVARNSECRSLVRTSDEQFAVFSL